MPVVLLTAHGESPGGWSAPPIPGHVLGNVTYLERPFHPTTLVSVTRSAIRSRRKQYEARASLERYKLLARELQHRTKNLLTVIMSLASASLPISPARDNFFARLHALARAQDLLHEQHGRNVSIKDLVAQAIESFGARVITDGPHVLLNASNAQGFANSLDEVGDECCQIRCPKHPDWHHNRAMVRRDMFGSSPQFPLARERRTTSIASMSKGFGTMLLEVAVASADMTLPRFEYSVEGFDYQLRVPLTKPVQTSGRSE